MNTVTVETEQQSEDQIKEATKGRDQKHSKKEKWTEKRTGRSEAQRLLQGEEARELM